MFLQVEIFRKFLGLGSDLDKASVLLGHGAAEATSTSQNIDSETPSDAA
jgi:hypothetical protein